MPEIEQTEKVKEGEILERKKTLNISKKYLSPPHSKTKSVKCFLENVSLHSHTLKSEVIRGGIDGSSGRKNPSSEWHVRGNEEVHYALWRTFPTGTKVFLKACWVTGAYFCLRSTSLVKCGKPASFSSLLKSPTAILFPSITGKVFYKQIFTNEIWLDSLAFRVWWGFIQMT